MAANPSAPNPLTSTEQGQARSRGPGKSLLKDRAYSQIKHRILHGDFEPGTFLSERQIAGWLIMSQTPVRAALERLAAEGFVAIAPQQGAIVRDLSVHEVADLFELREALETFVLRRLAGQLRPEQVTRLEQNLIEQKAAAEAGAIPRSGELDAEFHILFCEFLGNQEILRIMNHLREKIHRIILRVDAGNPGRLAISYQEHQAIAAAALQGNAELAVQRLQEHLEYGKRYLLSPRR